jgi:hypothetical protein
MHDRAAAHRLVVCCCSCPQGVPLVPPCLPNTAARHNGWRGLYGRLDLDGHFPTSTTDPQPMGKVNKLLSSASGFLLVLCFFFVVLFGCD